jgi:hypothetical protein
LMHSRLSAAAAARKTRRDHAAGLFRSSEGITFLKTLE